MKFLRSVAVSMLCLLTTVGAASAQVLQPPSRPEDRNADRSEAEAGRNPNAGGGTAHSSAVQEIVPQTTVTFSVPLNLSQLPPETIRVGVLCEVRSSAIVGVTSVSALTTLSPVDGQIHTTATVIVPVPRLENPVGKTGTYVCRLMAGRTPSSPVAEAREGQEAPVDWALFSAGASVAALRLTPDPAAITGSFQWSAPPTATAAPNVTTTSPGGNP
jgi:hypothetical protein